MLAGLHCWLMLHPRVARPLKLLVTIQLVTWLSVAVAPEASASTNAAVLNWTGLRDSYGVPAGDLFLSLARPYDLITQTGPDASMLDPGSWWPWAMHSMGVIWDSLTAANILTAEISVAVGIFTLAMWAFRLTISSYWITVLGEIARAISSAVISLTTTIGLIAIVLPIGVFIGVRAIYRGERGRGLSVIMMAFITPTLAVTLLSDPAGLMYGPNGLLQFARGMAFSTAQAATHGGAISGGGYTNQVDTLTSGLVTRVIREPLEVFNFGHVVDHVGGCGPMVSAAWIQGAKDGPIKALQQCGDWGAVHYAQNLDGNNVIGGLVLVLTVSLFGWFMVSSGAAVFMVSVKAIYSTAKLLPSLLAGSIEGTARAHANATMWKYFRHPFEVVVYITFVSVIGLAVERLISQPLPAALGQDSPFARLLIMGASSVAALHLLRHIRADLEGQGKPGRGLLARTGGIATYLGTRAALGAAGNSALAGMKGLAKAADSRMTPWEGLDQSASKSDPHEILGPPQLGFSPIAADLAGDIAMPAMTASGRSTDPAPAAAPILDRSAAGAVSVLDRPAPTGGLSRNSNYGRGSGKPLQPAATGQHRSATNRRTAPAAFDAQDALSFDAAAGVAPISEGSFDRRRTSEPPLSSYVDHTADVPFPLQEPPSDMDGPPDFSDAGRSVATVEPITDH